MLKLLFIHLRRGEPGRFTASKVLSWYGRTFIGGPKAEDIPSPDMSVRERIADTYFDLPVDRIPRKRNDKWEIGALWTAQLRDEEEKQVAVASFVNTAILCTALVASGGLIHKTTTGVETAWKEHKAKVAADEAKAYQAKRTDLNKRWLADAKAFSAQQCVDAVSDLRIRKTPEELDHYSALETGCAAKEAEIVSLGETWDVKRCLVFGQRIADDVKDTNGNMTWVDMLVWRQGCLTRYTAELTAAIKQ